MVRRHVAAPSSDDIIRRTPAGAQIVLTAGLISDTHIPSKDRPEGPIKGEDGSHTTAWSAITEGVRTALQNQTLTNAVAELVRLDGAARLLPGATDERVAALHHERRAVFTATSDELTRKRIAAQVPAPTLGAVQEYITAYLAYRNAMPLSTAKKGGYANSRGESTAIGVLRDYANRTPAAIRKAMYDLLDLGALAAFGEADDEFVEDDVVPEPSDESGSDEAEDIVIDAYVNIDYPGAIDGENPLEDRQVAIVQQHFQTMASSFPAAYARAGLTPDVIVAELLSRAPEADEGDEESFVPDDGTDVPIPASPFDGLLAGRIPAAAVVGAPAGRTRTNSSFSVETPLRAVDGCVDLVKVGDRPRGLFGAADRKHTTAWTLFANGVSNRMEGRTVPQAIVALDELLASTLALPGAALTANIGDAGSLDGLTRQARDARDTAHGLRNDAAANPTGVQAALQDAVRAYLTLRNHVPLTAANPVAERSRPGGKSESDHIETVMHHEENQRDVRGAAAAVLGLLDVGIIARYRPSAALRDYPGMTARDGPGKFALLVLQQHLLTLKVNFPRTFDSTRDIIVRAVPKLLSPTIRRADSRKRIARQLAVAVGSRVRF